MIYKLDVSHMDFSICALSAWQTTKVPELTIDNLISIIEKQNEIIEAVNLLFEPGRELQ